MKRRRFSSFSFFQPSLLSTNASVNEEVLHLNGIAVADDDNAAGDTEVAGKLCTPDKGESSTTRTNNNNNSHQLIAW